MNFDPQGPFKRDPATTTPDARSSDADTRCFCPVPPRRSAHRTGPMVANDRRHGGAPTHAAIRRSSAVSNDRGDKCSSMLRKSPRAVRADATRLQRQVGWRPARRRPANCRPSPAAQYIWSYGADLGEFSGVVVDAYLKDLPIPRVEANVLIAYEMNGRALLTEHGFPARLVVPGFYGTNSV